MDSSTDIKRNQPAEKGQGNDPHVRDEDASQPGVNTVSSSENDEANKHLTRTASDSFREDKAGDEKADKSFDE